MASWSSYDQDLRDRVLRAEGSIRDVATPFGVSHSYVARAHSQRRRLGEDTPGVQRSHMPLKLTGLEQSLIGKVKAVNNLTLKQLCDWLQIEHGVRLGISTLWKTLARLGISLKKAFYASELSAMPAMAGQRENALVLWNQRAAMTCQCPRL